MKNKRYGDYFDWVIIKSRVLNLGIGFVCDVIFGIGYYLYFSIKGKIFGQRVSYSSNFVFGSINGVCFLFYYYMSGEGVGKLIVFILCRSGWVFVVKLVWSKIGSVDGGWCLVRVLFLNSFIMQRYDVMFMGIVGKGVLGDIVFDDIILINIGIC